MYKDKVTLALYLNNIYSNNMSHVLIYSKRRFSDYVVHHASEAYSTKLVTVKRLRFWFENINLNLKFIYSELTHRLTEASCIKNVMSEWYVKTYHFDGKSGSFLLRTNRSFLYITFIRGLLFLYYELN